MDEVSTTCGSGWVSDQNAILLVILEANGDPPATAGGTDLIQARRSDFEAIPFGSIQAKNHQFLQDYKINQDELLIV